jgi:hypothetical protein
MKLKVEFYKARTTHKENYPNDVFITTQKGIYKKNEIDNAVQRTRQIYKQGYKLQEEYEQLLLKNVVEQKIVLDADLQQFSVLPPYMKTMYQLQINKIQTQFNKIIKDEQDLNQSITNRAKKVQELEDSVQKCAEFMTYDPKKDVESCIDKTNLNKYDSKCGKNIYLNLHPDKNIYCDYDATIAVKNYNACVDKHYEETKTGELIKRDKDKKGKLITSINCDI